MILNNKTLEKLRILINEQTEYRSGPQLIAFFNELGSRDQYRSGFPSRWVYTDEKLKKLNGTPELDKCMKTLFNPINYIGKYDHLDNLITEFNQFLAFDNWQVIRNNTEITFQRAEKISIPNTPQTENVSEDSFLNQEFINTSLDKLGLDAMLTNCINSRLGEINKSLQIDAPLSVIFLSGSSLEGILLGIALNNVKAFNMSRTAPRKDNKVKSFHEWTLSNFIDTAYDLGIIKEDVKKFSHALRDFRNYIHPMQQINSNFQPDQHTARICWQVLRAAIYQLGVNQIISPILQ